MESKPQFQVMITGLGGQGALLFGQLLSDAGINVYKNVSYFPQYATVMRGGESECTVTLSDDEVDSLLVFNPQTAVVMAAPKLRLFEEKVQSGGTLIVDNSVVHEKVNRKDVTVYYIPATKAADELGDKRAANLVFLGAYVEMTKVVPMEEIEKALERKMSGGKEAFIEGNKKALAEGARLMAEYKG